MDILKSIIEIKSIYCWEKKGLMIDEEVAIHLRESLLTPDQEIIMQDNGQSLFIAHVQNTGKLVDTNGM